MGLPECEHEESTMGGYVFGLLGRLPKVGDKVEDVYCEYEVIGIDNMRIPESKPESNRRRSKMMKFKTLFIAFVLCAAASAAQAGCMDLPQQTRAGHCRF